MIYLWYQLAAIAATQIVELRKMRDRRAVSARTFSSYLRRLADLSKDRCYDNGIRSEADQLTVWSMAIEIADERQREEVIA